MSLVSQYAIAAAVTLMVLKKHRTTPELVRLTGHERVPIVRALRALQDEGLVERIKVRGQRAPIWRWCDGGIL